MGKPNIEKLRAKKDVEKLIKALCHKDSSVREGAAQALGEIKEKSAFEPLSAALQDEHWSVRWKTAEALGEIKDSRAVIPLIASLKDKNNLVRSASVSSLGKIKDPAAVKSLVAVLSDESIRNEAATALINIGWKPSDDKEIVAFYIASKQWDNLEKLGVQAVEPLINALKDKDEDVQKNAVKVLRKIVDKKAVEPLIAALKDDENYWTKKTSLAFILAEIGTQAVEPLIVALKDENASVREYSAKALGEIGDKRAIDHLIYTLKDQHECVRISSILALGKIGDERAVTPIITALQDDAPHVKGAAAEALGVLKDARALDHLVAFIKKNKGTWMQFEAIESLGKIGDEKAVEFLRDLLKDEDEDVREKISEALEEIKTIKIKKKEIKGIKTLEDFLMRSDILNSDDCLIPAINELKNQGTRGSESLSLLINELLSCRSGKIVFALRVTKELQPIPELIKAVNLVCSATETIAEPANCRFSPEIFGGGKIGWTTGSHVRIIKIANDVLKVLKKKLGKY